MKVYNDNIKYVRVEGMEIDSYTMRQEGEYLVITPKYKDTLDTPKFFKDEIVFFAEGTADGSQKIYRKAGTVLMRKKLSIRTLAATMAGARWWEGGEEPWASWGRDGIIAVWSGEPEIDSDGSYDYGNAKERVAYIDSVCLPFSPEKWRIE